MGCWSSTLLFLWFVGLVMDFRLGFDATFRKPRPLLDGESRASFSARCWLARSNVASEATLLGDVTLKRGVGLDEIFNPNSLRCRCPARRANAPTDFRALILQPDTSHTSRPEPGLVPQGGRDGGPSFCFTRPG